jgi:hypothetical protein
MGNGLCGGYGLCKDSTPTGSPAARSPGPNERTSPRTGSSPEPATTEAGPEQQQRQQQRSQQHPVVTPAPPAGGANPDAAAAGHPPEAAAPTSPSPAPRVPLMASTPANRKAAEDLKTEGNLLFSKGKYAAAIEVGWVGIILPSRRASVTRTFLGPLGFRFLPRRGHPVL